MSYFEKWSGTTKRAWYGDNLGVRTSATMNLGLQFGFSNVVELAYKVRIQIHLLGAKRDQLLRDVYRLHGDGLRCNVR